jgi:signal transduction histidine kinase
MGMLLCCVAAHGALGAETNVVVLAADGAWNWLSDPRAVFHHDILYFGYARRADGRAVLASFDPQTGARNTLWGSVGREQDDFNVPSILVRQDGRLLVTYAQHGSQPFFSYRISATTNPAVPAAWGPEERGPDTGAPVHYANLFALGQPEAIFNVVRNQGANPTLFVSTNGGRAWSKPQVFVEGPRASSRPYVKHFSNDRKRVDFFYTDGHPRDVETSIYHVYLEDGMFRTSDGALLKEFHQLPLRHSQGEKGSVVYPFRPGSEPRTSESIPGGRPWVWDVARNSSGEPVGVFSISSRGVAGSQWFDDRIYYFYARWTGSNWQRRFVAHGGRPLYSSEKDYAGGICVDPENPDVVYISSNSANPADVDDPQGTGLSPNERYEIWKGVTRNGGLTFEWERVTTDSPVDNLRPYVARDFKGSGVLLWFRGHYRSYTAYDCEIVGKFSRPVVNLPLPQAREWGVLTNAAQIRGLTAAEAARRFPVRLQGTIVLEPGGSGRLVLLDQTAGIYVQGASGPLTGLKRGDLVEIGGVTDPGEFAPFVSLSSLRRLGAGEIPAPRAVSFEQLISGRFDAQWVEVAGVVRQLETMVPHERFKLYLATGGGRLAVEIIGDLDPAILVDAEVRLPGISFYQVNRSRQVISPLLVVPRGAVVSVEKPAPASPFGTPVLSSASLLQFAPQGAYGHRVHLRGVVTHHAPGEKLWIRDMSGGLEVQSGETNQLHPGDVVDVLGFPSRGSYSPMVEDAVFKKSGSVEVPQPLKLFSPTAALEHDGDLVQVRAKLTGRHATSDGWALVMREGETVFRAVLRLQPFQQLPADWLDGSEVQLTGLAAVRLELLRTTAGIAEPRSFEILLRGLADVKIIQPPPWWTRERVVWALTGIACLLLVVVAGVIWSARRRLQEQAVQRALAEAEFSAILSERNRMAREIHDTLAQGLSAISMQLELTKSRLPAEAGFAAESVERAHSLVRSSLAEARNSIWNMRSQVLETRNLSEALAGILQQLTDGTEVTGRFETRGRERRLPPVTENNLLRIGQEAITNAVTHAQARSIEVIVEYRSKSIHLWVRDDGVGFETEHPPKSESGFGLMGMRERAQELRGELQVSSAPGKGTELTLRVPVAT